MSWTDERIDRLKAMWNEGKTASQIAEELGGVSRNAVIGKAHRLGLDARPSPVKGNEDKPVKAEPTRGASTKAREKPPIAAVLEAAAPMPEEVKTPPPAPASTPASAEPAPAAAPAVAKADPAMQ